MATASVIAPAPASPPEELFELHTTLWSKIVSALAVPIMATLMALIIGGVVMAIARGSLTIPFDAYHQLAIGAFGSWYDIQETLTESIPLIFAALAVAFSFRGGLFNIGAEGQMYAGAIFSTFIGISLHWNVWILLPVCVIASAVAGAMWALIPGLLKAYRGAHEVITTMMLNYVALNLLHYLVNVSTSGSAGPLQGTPAIPSSIGVNARFPIIVPGFLVQFADLNAAFLLAIVCGIAFWFILARTTLGYNVRATGFNIKAARYAGINVSLTIVLTLVISGAFAGLAGSAYVFGVGGQLQDTFDSFTFGFDAIAVALLGKNTAAGAVLAAILFGALDQGGRNMQAISFIDPHIISIIQGLIIFFVGAEALVRYVTKEPANGFLWVARHLGSRISRGGKPPEAPAAGATT
ncbi:MAG TPA: ABC transporter permease [Chloroflexota bacterium]|nr:ABC transporter permease [Chloroflexota bacterium]